MDKCEIDFVDALTLRTMKKNKIDEIYSNDKDFDRVQWIKKSGNKHKTLHNTQPKSPQTSDKTQATTRKPTETTQPPNANSHKLHRTCLETPNRKQQQTK